MKILVTDWSDPDSISSVTPEEAALYSSGYIFDPSWEPKVRKVVEERAALKKAYDDSMRLVYELINERARAK